MNAYERLIAVLWAHHPVGRSLRALSLPRRLVEYGKAQGYVVERNGLFYLGRDPTSKDPLFAAVARIVATEQGRLHNYKSQSAKQKLRAFLRMKRESNSWAR